LTDDVNLGAARLVLGTVLYDDERGAAGGAGRRSMSRDGPAGAAPQAPRHPTGGFYGGDVGKLSRDMLKPTVLLGVPRVFEKIGDNLTNSVTGVKRWLLEVTLLPSQNISDQCQSTVQSPRSAGTNQENNLKEKRFFFVSNTSVRCRLSVRTKSVVEIHECYVLRQFELCRDESETRGDEEREHL
jgi:hypothetical protein